MEQHSGVVLLIGPPAPISSLASGILGFGKLSESKTLESLPALSTYLSTPVDLGRPNISFREYCFELETKYYQAPLRLWVIEDGEFSRGVAPLLRALGPMIKSSIEGVILAFDAAIPESFDAVAVWADLLGTVKEASLETSDSDEFGLQLLVAVNTAALGAATLLDEDTRVERMEWGLDRAYEFVEVPTCTDVAALRQGFADRDKDGLPRVCEAAEATRWSTLTMKAQMKSRPLGGGDNDVACSGSVGVGGGSAPDFFLALRPPEIRLAPTASTIDLKGVVLLIGAQPAASTLAAGLLGFQRVATSSSARCFGEDLPALSTYPSTPVDLPGSPGTSFREFAWELDTKYYTAPLRLWVIEDKEFLSGSSSVLTALGMSLECSAGVEGVILAFEASEDGSFKAVSSWAGHVAALKKSGGCGGDDLDAAAGESVEPRDSDGFGLQLLVAVNTAAVGAATLLDEDTRMERMEWGLDRAYEFVEVPTCTDVAALRQGFADRDKDGLPRVCEAAEATRWSTLTMKAHRGGCGAGKVSSVEGEGGGGGGGGGGGTENRGDEPSAETSTVECSDRKQARGGLGLAAELGAVPDAKDKGVGEEGGTFVAGDAVFVVGLAAAAHHNGSNGTVVRFDDGKGRFVVRLQPEKGTNPKTVLAVKACNLRHRNTAVAVSGSPTGEGNASDSLLLAPATSGTVVGGGERRVEARSDAKESGNDHHDRIPGSEASLNRDMNALEGLIEDVKHARENTKNLTDEQRRATAASTAMKLLATLGDGDDSDSEDF